MLSGHLLLSANVPCYPLHQCINHIRQKSSGGFHGFNHVHGSWSGTKLADKQFPLTLVSIQTNIPLCHLWITFADCINVGESHFKVFHKLEHSSWILEIILLLQ